MIQQNKDWNLPGCRPFSGPHPLPEHDPTEQGLKHKAQKLLWPHQSLPEHDPTEQGLKLLLFRLEHPSAVAPRAWSNRTRIETPHDQDRSGAIGLPEHDPTEQGLKPQDYRCLAEDSSAPRAWSNRTRIETSMSFTGWTSWPTPRAWSNRTRIETPLKPTHHENKNHSPSMIQQNKDWNHHRIPAFVRVLDLPEHDPTEQGLKLRSFSSFPSFRLTPRAWSNRTRIETEANQRPQVLNASPRAWSNRTRIETEAPRPLQPE